jgi:Ribonuclease G/E
MASLEVFLDDTPGETRGVIVRDGRFDRLLIERDDDIAQHRLGARSVGRVVEVHTGLKGAFVDLGGGTLAGFLPFRAEDRFTTGQKLQVEVVGEPRERKGPTLRVIGAGEGEPGLLANGPTVAESLAQLAPARPVTTGLDAIRAGREAEEEALANTHIYPDAGLDLAVQRTRALVAVDFDLSPAPGVAFGPPARARANRRGLLEAARLIQLKRWGGLVAIDLVGAGREAEAAAAVAREAFAGPEAAFGPVSRFGLLQLSLPWRMTPIEEVLLDPAGRRTPATCAIDLMRALRERLLADTAAPRVGLRCAPMDHARAAPLVARLGPRAHLIVDPALPPGAYAWEES